MTDAHFEPKRRGEPKRDQWGRYLLPDPATGEQRSWTRATTISGLLSDRYNLELWAQRMVALGLADRIDLLALVKTHRDDKRALNRVVKDALEAGNKEQRANIGTAIHGATEVLDRGGEVDIPAPYDKDVAAYAEKMAAANLVVVPGWVERIVVNPNLGAGVAGTLDRLVDQGRDLRERGANPFWTKPRIADIKTGSTISFSELEHCIQQAIYANATHYWDEDTEQLVPMPEIDRETALIIHVPAGTAQCSIHALDIAAGWEAAQIAADIHANWRKRKGLSTVLA